MHIESSNHLSWYAACRHAYPKILVASHPVKKSTLQATPPTVLGLGQASPLRVPTSPRHSNSPVPQRDPQLGTPVATSPLHEEDLAANPLPTCYCPSPARQAAGAAAPGSATGGSCDVHTPLYLLPEQPHRIGRCRCCPSGCLYSCQHLMLLSCAMLTLAHLTTQMCMT